MSILIAAVVLSLIITPLLMVAGKGDRRRPRIGDIIVSIIAGPLIGFAFALFAGIIVSLLLSDSVEMESYVDKTTHISALKDGSSVQGDFFLASGSVDEVPMYFFAKKKSGGIVMDSIEAEDVIIIEDDTEEPRIVEYAGRFKSDRLEYWLPSTPTHVETRIYVPEGTVTTKFDIDLE
jgi:phosphate/sulfate permease